MDVQEGVSPFCRYFGQFEVDVQEGVSPFCRYFSQFEVDGLEGVSLFCRYFGQCEVRLVFVRLSVGVQTDSSCMFEMQMDRVHISSVSWPIRGSNPRPWRY